MTPERTVELAKQAGSPYRNRHYKDVVTAEVSGAGTASAGLPSSAAD